MHIGEVSRQCKLTKKAINYYEQEGLLHTTSDTNGYRLYTEQDIRVLKQIYILRKLGMSVADIKGIVGSTNHQLALEQYRAKQQYQLEQMQAQHHYLLDMINQNLSVDEVFHEIDDKLDLQLAVKDKLLQAFPGAYGKYLHIHFGRFLDGSIETPEQINAYYSIIEYLDQVDSAAFEQKLLDGFDEQFQILDSMDLTKLNEGMHNLIHDYDAYMDQHKETLEWYMEYRSSEQFKSDPAYLMQQKLLEFQQQNGYYDVFIPNLILLSESYRTYTEQLSQANEQFMKQYPQANR